MSTIMLTGGSGFIGSHVLLKLCASLPEHKIVNVDAQTYAARPPLYFRKLDNLVEERVDIRDQAAVQRVMRKYDPNYIVHLAAESHVCRSITGPKDFVTTNIIGTFNLLEEFRQLDNPVRFVHISTDEVFGEIREGYFDESAPVLPRNPYAASKASSDLLVRAYHETYGLETVTVRMANNFGPNQHMEKLIPRTIMHLLKGIPVTIYGKGDHVREWLWVKDAARAIVAAMVNGKSGSIYCIPGELELTNLETVQHVYRAVSESVPGVKLQIKHVDGRPTDDFRYAMKPKNLSDLQWKRTNDFPGKLQDTVNWYVRAMLTRGGRASQGRGV
jgi:dTDP-glucose 4,6-dehydratase